MIWGLPQDILTEYPFPGGYLYIYAYGNLTCGNFICKIYCTSFKWYIMQVMTAWILRSFEYAKNIATSVIGLIVFPCDRANDIENDSDSAQQFWGVIAMNRCPLGSLGQCHIVASF